MEVVIDTNFLLSALKFKVKMPAGKLVILSGVVRELERIAGSRGRDALLAKTALQIIEKRSARKISRSFSMSRWDTPMCKVFWKQFH